jgi:hypothetical protein
MSSRDDGEEREMQEGSLRLGFVERAVAGERGRARWNPDVPIFEPRPREVFGSAVEAMESRSVSQTGFGREEERAAGGVGMERTGSGGVVVGRRLIEFGELGEPVDWGRKREESRRRE